MLDKTSSIICAFCLSSLLLSRSPHRHLEIVRCCPHFHSAKKRPARQCTTSRSLLSAIISAPAPRLALVTRRASAGQPAGFDVRLRLNIGSLAGGQLFVADGRAWMDAFGMSMSMRVALLAQGRWGRRRAASGETWPMAGAAGRAGEAAVGDERHGTCPAPCPPDGAGGVEHLAHAGAALGAFVADDHHVAGRGSRRRRWRRWPRPRSRSTRAGPLWTQHLGRHGRLRLTTAAVGGEVALAESCDAAGLGVGVVERADDLVVADFASR